MPPTLISSFSLASAIGINTDSPNSALTVVGDISASGYLYGDGSLLKNAIPLNLTLSNLSITNSLTVQGSATTISTQNLVVTDNIIYLNQGEDFQGVNGNLLDIGFVAHFNPTTALSTYNHTGLIRRAGQGTPGTWTLFSGLTTEPLTASNLSWSDATLTLDTLSANIVTPGGNSNNWNSNYTTVQNTSSNWQGAYTWVNTNSANASHTTLTLTNTASQAGINQPLLTLYGSANASAFAQLQNTANTLSASTDISVYNNLGNYLDVGINSSSYNGSTYPGGPFTITGPGDGYIYNTSSNLVLGNTSNAPASSSVIIFAGGSLSGTAAQGGHEVARFLSGGFVGIGTTTPNKTLTVVGDISATGNVYSVAGTLGTGSGGGGNVTGAYVPLSGGTMTGGLSVVTPSSNGVYINSNTNPLTIVGNNTSTSDVVAIGLSSATTNRGLVFYQNNASGGMTNSIIWRANAGSFFDFANITTTYGSGYADSYMAFSVANASRVISERMRINVNGNVGIGTTAPNNTLTVNGNVSANNFYGTGNQLVLSDGQGSNDLGSGANTLSMNFTNGVYMSGSGLTFTGTPNINATTASQITANSDLVVTGNLYSNNQTYVGYLSSNLTAASAVNIFSINLLANKIYEIEAHVYETRSGAAGTITPSFSASSNWNNLNAASLYNSSATASINSATQQSLNVNGVVNSSSTNNVNGQVTGSIAIGQITYHRYNIIVENGSSNATFITKHTTATSPASSQVLRGSYYKYRTLF